MVFLVVSLLVVRCGVAFGFVCCLIGLISRFGDLGVCTCCCVYFSLVGLPMWLRLGV